MMNSPCAMLMMRMTPNMSDRPVAKRAYSPPTNAPWMIVLIQYTIFSHAEIRELDLLSRKLVRASFQCYAAFLHAVNTIRGLQGSVDILFYDQDCRPLSPDPRHGCVNVANDNRCKSKTELVTK